MESRLLVFLSGGPRFADRAMSDRLILLLIAMHLPAAALMSSAQDGQAAAARQQLTVFAETHCIACHAGEESEGDFAIDAVIATTGLSDAAASHWERILRRIQSRQMPPPETEKPTEAEFKTVIETMVSALDQRAARHPRPGRTSPLRRLTRVEYANAIRDLLSLDVDVAEMLPKDESSHGFDNITVEELSPLLLSRYLDAAEKISALAVGRNVGVTGVVVRVPQDRTQEGHVVGLPLGTRGGVLIEHTFPQSGNYEIQIKLARDRDEKVEGLFETYNLDVLVDRARIHRFEVRAPGKGGDWKVDHTNADSHLRGRFEIDAGPHHVGVTFPQKWDSLNEIKREPFHASFNRHRHPRRTPAVYEVSITGPFDAEEVAETPSRRAVFGDAVESGEPSSEEARGIIRRLATRAYRRSVTEADLATPMAFFESGLANGGFELGIQNALSAILVNPNFLFRIEQTPEGSADDASYLVPATELASRLSFFLWSSLPDDELLQLAESGDLAQPEVLDAQVTRMLDDRRSESLVTNFGAQWLYLRNLASLTPDLRRFPDFDDNLRHAMRRETELVLAEIIRQDRSILDLLQCDFTYVNDRLAMHYEIPGVVGSHFQRVAVDESSHRGGLLRHASVLAATSYATRTSPTIRGNWVLENILGTPAPPPPPNVPNLKEKAAFEALSVRERLAAHRENPACASCHNLMDPMGFALENFDALGRWREYDGELPLDVTGVLPDGQMVRSVDDLEAAILKHPELFVGATVRKLMTFALGRGVELSDEPAVRAVVRQAANEDYRFSALIRGIVHSPPFLMREPDSNAALRP